MQSDIGLAVVFAASELDPLQRRLRPELLAIDWNLLFSCTQPSMHVETQASDPQGKLVTSQATAICLLSFTSILVVLNLVVESIAPDNQPVPNALSICCE